MHFSNVQIPLHELPQVEAADFQPLEKEYLQVQRITYIITTIIVLLALTAAIFFIDDLQQYEIIIPAAALFVIITIVGWLATRLNYSFSGYAIREQDVLYRSGWFTRRTRIVPLNRVQHVSVQSGPIERKYKLASVSIYTAGAEQADFTIKGITNETAVQVKDWITNQMHGRDNTL
ncbi:PH domain-containing protein [Aridibaculum aurantiacum]|uniref:PH domain-containing protein n=1 Tax=Aridibaculum aurantiacum TaxID=2810307 RepID=UPI001A961495|nr:PH domain-containing protein [Aridibaculum aurantiacum]